MLTQFDQYGLFCEMQLGTYLEQHSIPPAAFAADVAVSARTIYRYISGARVPRKLVMERIQELTGGKVAPKDWFEPQESVGASAAALNGGAGYVNGVSS